MKTPKHIYLITDESIELPEWASALNHDYYHFTIGHSSNNQLDIISRPEDYDLIIAEPAPTALHFFEAQLAQPEYHFGLPVIFLLSEAVQNAFGETLEDLGFQKVYAPFHPKNLEAIITAAVTENKKRLNLKRSHQLLSFRSAWLELVFQNETDIVFWVTNDGVYLDYYTEQDNNLALPGKEFIGKKIDELVIFDSPNEIIKLIQRASESDATLQFEYTIDLQGTPKSYSGRLRKYDDHTVLIAVKDQTAIKETNRMLEETGRKNAELLEQYATIQKLELYGTVVFNEEGVIIEANNYFCKMIGYPPDELIGMNVLEIDVIDDLEQYQKRILQLKSEGQIRFETKHKRKDNSVIDTEVSIGYWAAKGKYIAFVSDISERIQEQRALHQMESKLQLALEAANEGIWEWDILSDHLYWSPRSFTMLGYEPDEFSLSFSKFRELIHPDDLPELLVTLKKRLSESENFMYEFRYRKKDGDYLWVMGKGRIIEWDYDGNPKHLIGTHSDIHKRKTAELLLQETEQRYRIVADWTYDWEMWLRPDNSIEYISPSVERITGYKTEEFLAKPELIDEIVAPAYKETWIEHKDHTHHDTEDGISCNMQLQIITKNGEPRWIGHLSRAIYDSDGNYLGLRVSNRDLTHMIDALQEVQKLKAAIEQSSFIVLITDIHGMIEYVNAPAERITLYSREEMIGQKTSMFKSGAVPIEKYKELWETIMSGHIWNGELINRKKNGLLYWESIEISPIRNQQGVITHFLATKEDISDKKLMENELSAYRSNLEMIVTDRTKQLIESETKLNKALESEKALSELKSRFISTASHEFRTPLAAILSASQAIQMYSHKWSKSKIDTYQKKIEEAIRHLTSMLDEILNISKVEQGHIKPQYVPLPVDEFLHKCISSAAHYLHAKTDFKLINKLKSKTINCDTQMLRSIIENLLSNAFKFTPPGRSVQLIISGDKNYNIFTVKDEGIGMSSEELDRVYEPFYRTEQSSIIPGTGLGLNIVQQYISILNGTISVQSAPGQGTTFVVRIPKKVA